MHYNISLEHLRRFNYDSFYRLRSNPSLQSATKEMAYENFLLSIYAEIDIKYKEKVILFYCIVIFQETTLM